MNLSRDGAAHHPRALVPAQLAAVEAAVAPFAADKAGVRLFGVEQLRPLLAGRGAIGRIAAAALGPTVRPVRALLFKKTIGLNWSLGWHQDRTIVVRHRADFPGFGPWTFKTGLQHVEPPFPLLARMLTLRVHLDPVGPDNAPLLIAPASHLRGRIPEPEIAAVVQRSGTHACLADAGDIWVYATPILHASEASRVDQGRRVLQIDYSPDELPAPLEWLGV